MRVLPGSFWNCRIILLPAPNDLKEYGAIAARVLREVRKRVKRKGKEHNRYIEELL